MESRPLRFLPHRITKLLIRTFDVQVISTLVLKVQFSLSGILTVIPQNLDVFRDGDNSMCLCFKFNISPSVCPLSLVCLIFLFLSASSVSITISGSIPPRSLLAPHVLTTRPNITSKEMPARIRYMPRRAYSSTSHRTSEGKQPIPTPPDMVTMGTAR